MRYSLNELEDTLNKQDVFSSYGIKRMGVFGSFARGEKFKDIDILIEDALSLQQACMLRDELESNLGFKIDLVLKDRCDPIILRRALLDLRYVERH